MVASAGSDTRISLNIDIDEVYSEHLKGSDGARVSLTHNGQRLLNPEVWIEHGDFAFLVATSRALALPIGNNGLEPARRLLTIHPVALLKDLGRRLLCLIEWHRVEDEEQHLLVQRPTLVGCHHVHLARAGAASCGGRPNLGYLVALWKRELRLQAFGLEAPAAAARAS